MSMLVSTSPRKAKTLAQRGNSFPRQKGTSLMQIVCDKHLAS